MSSSKLSISEITKLYKEKKLSPVEHTQEAFLKIEKQNPEVRAFVQLAEESAMKAAKEAEKNFMDGVIKSPLQGITVGLKDVIYTKDSPVTMETELYYENPIFPGYDSTVAEKLRAGGAVILGKTNTHEMGMGPTGDVGYSGHAKNPYDLTKVTGGSSSGSAAATAAGLADFTIGSDSGGSIRLPAALSGVVGMKSTFGRTSNYGFAPLCYSCDNIGPMTNTIEDNALALGVISGYDERNMYSLDVANEDFTRYLGDSIKGMKVGVPYRWLEELIDDEVRDSTLNAIEVFKSLGANIIDLSKEGLMPSRAEMEKFRLAHGKVLIADGYYAHQPELLHPDKIAPAIYLRLLTGNISSLEYVSSYQQKQVILDMYNKIYSEVDVMLTPSVSVPACDRLQTEIEIQGEKHTTMKLYTDFTWFDSFTGYPSLAVPSGFTKSGLPLSVLINGKRKEEAKVYQFGHALEKELNLKFL